MLQIPDSLSIVWHSLPASIGDAHVWGRLCVCVCVLQQVCLSVYVALALEVFLQRCCKHSLEVLYLKNIVARVVTILRTFLFIMESLCQ